MKKITFLLPLIALNVLGLSGCKPSLKARITYGSLVASEATELKYNQLVSRVENNETMLVAVYEDSLPCGCWTTFKSVINQYVDEYDTMVYYIARSQFSEDANRYGLTILEDGTAPTFALIKNGKKSTEYIYSNNNRPLFETLEGLRSAVTRIARDPEFYYVDEEYLDRALFEENASKVVIHYIWNFCPDCLDCFPNVLVPYAQKNECKTPIWIMDLGVKGYVIDEDGHFNKENPTYVEFLEEHHMSYAGDEIFGYDRGFVPTTQIWENGVLKDMDVYFNDTINKLGNKYIVQQSYFSTDRVQHLSYTNTVLEGITVPADDVEVSNDGEEETYAWKKDAARKYHQPLLEAFLDKYVK